MLLQRGGNKRFQTFDKPSKEMFSLTATAWGMGIQGLVF